MGAPGFHRYDPAEPLGLVRWEMAAPVRYPRIRAFHFEFTSRGDRVPGRLWLPPEATSPAPVVLLQHGVGGSRQAPYLDASAGPWVEAGLAVASVDFPLHGDRASPKLSAHLALALREAVEGAGTGSTLLHEFFQQAVADLRRAVSALAEMPDVDTERAAYAGFSLGAIVGAAFCAADPRPRAAVFALGGGGAGPAALDPARTVAGFAPRPALFLNARDDEVISRESALAFFEGAGEPRQHLWFEGTHTELPGDALKAMLAFLAEHLGAP
jgi:dienelactone hydrolase